MFANTANVSAGLVSEGVLKPPIGSLKPLINRNFSEILSTVHTQFSNTGVAAIAQKRKQLRLYCQKQKIQ